jgi:hypothetical protein
MLTHAHFSQGREKRGLGRKEALLHLLKIAAAKARPISFRQSNADVDGRSDRFSATHIRGDIRRGIGTRARTRIEPFIEIERRPGDGANRTRKSLPQRTPISGRLRRLRPRTAKRRPENSRFGTTSNQTHAPGRARLWILAAADGVSPD